MNHRVLRLLLGLLFIAAPAMAQGQNVTGKVTSEQGTALAGVQILVKGTTTGAVTNDAGNYTVRATQGQVLVFRHIGHAMAERTVGTETVINVSLRRIATQLDATVVTALGLTSQQRSVGTATQTDRKSVV